MRDDSATLNCEIDASEKLIEKLNGELPAERQLGKSETIEVQNIREELATVRNANIEVARTDIGVDEGAERLETIINPIRKLQPGRRRQESQA